MDGETMKDRRHWVAIELDFADHPKMLRVGAAGGWAHLRAILYAARYGTDGFVPTEAIWRILHDDPVMDTEADDGLLESMVEAGLWHPVANGYQIHDYLEHQATSESIREKRRRAGRLGGLAKAKQTAQQTSKSKLDVDVDVDKEKTPTPQPVVPTTPQPDLNGLARLGDEPARILAAAARQRALEDEPL